MKNLINKIGTITVEEQIKMHRKVRREENLVDSVGFKAKNKTHKDKKKEANKRACREFKF